MRACTLRHDATHIGGVCACLPLKCFDHFKTAGKLAVVAPRMHSAHACTCMSMHACLLFRLVCFRNRIGTGPVSNYYHVVVGMTACMYKQEARQHVFVSVIAAGCLPAVLVGRSSTVRCNWCTTCVCTAARHVYMQVCTRVRCSWAAPRSEDRTPAAGVDKRG